MRPDQIRGGVAYPNLFCMMNRLFEMQRIVDNRIQLDGPRRRENESIAPSARVSRSALGSHRGNLESGDNGLNRDPAFFFQHFADSLAALLR